MKENQSVIKLYLSVVFAENNGVTYLGYPKKENFSQVFCMHQLTSSTEAPNEWFSMFQKLGAQFPQALPRNLLENKLQESKIIINTLI